MLGLTSHQESSDKYYGLLNIYIPRPYSIVYINIVPSLSFEAQQLGVAKEIWQPSKRRYVSCFSSPSSFIQRGGKAFLGGDRR